MGKKKAAIQEYGSALRLSQAPEEFDDSAPAFAGPSCDSAPPQGGSVETPSSIIVPADSSSDISIGNQAPPQGGSGGKTRKQMKIEQFEAHINSLELGQYCSICGEELAITVSTPANTCIW